MTSDDILEKLEQLGAGWDELDNELQVLIEGILVGFATRWYAKRYWLKRGAPEWAAKALASLGTAISLAPAVYAVKLKSAERERAKREAERKLKSRQSRYDIP